MRKIIPNIVEDRLKYKLYPIAAINAPIINGSNSTKMILISKFLVPTSSLVSVDIFDNDSVDDMFALFF